MSAGSGTWMPADSLLCMPRHLMASATCAAAAQRSAPDRWPGDMTMSCVLLSKALHVWLGSSLQSAGQAYVCCCFSSYPCRDRQKQ